MTTPDMFERLRPLINQKGLDKLAQSTVMVFGLGGVGSFAAEALARSGIGRLILIDKDTVAPSNLNRQLPALHSTLGRNKVDVMAERIKDINPACTVITHGIFYTLETKSIVWETPVDAVIDAIDTVTFKIDIIKECIQRDVHFITCLGQGNRMHPENVTITTLFKTTHDPLARAMRFKLKHLDHKCEIPCVFSEEIPKKLTGKRQPASSSLVPPVAGFMAASYIINTLLEELAL